MTPSTPHFPSVAPTSNYFPERKTIQVVGRGYERKLDSLDSDYFAAHYPSAIPEEDYAMYQIDGILELSTTQLEYLKNHLLSDIPQAENYKSVLVVESTLDGTQKPAFIFQPFGCSYPRITVEYIWSVNQGEPLFVY